MEDSWRDVVCSGTDTILSTSKTLRRPLRYLWPGFSFIKKLCLVQEATPLVTLRPRSRKGLIKLLPLQGFGSPNSEGKVDVSGEMILC